jgi:hypothetical protein
VTYLRRDRYRVMHMVHIIIIVVIVYLLRCIFTKMVAKYKYKLEIINSTGSHFEEYIQINQQNNQQFRLLFGLQ